MKLALLTPILFFCILTDAFSQVFLAKKWDHTFGGDLYDNFTTIIQTADSGFVIGGYTSSDTSGDVSQPTQGGRDFWIVKTDSTGQKKWDKRFGGSFQDRLFAVHQTTDKGFILGGFTTSDSGGDVSEPTHGSMDYWIVKTDSMGNKLWDKRYGGVDYDQLSCVQQTSDGGYIVGGWTFSDSTGDVSQHTQGSEDMWIVKTDSAGNKLWDKRFGGISVDECFAIQQTTDGGFILGGFTSSDSSGDVSQVTNGASDMWVVKTDALGNKLWDKRFGGIDGEGLSALQQTKDGGYILGGRTSSDSSGDVSQATRDTSLAGNNRGDIWTVKIDSLGSKQWDKRFGGAWIEGGAANIIQTKDKCYLFGGESFSGISGDKTENNLGATQSWIIKTDSLGNKIFDKTLFTNSDDKSGYPIQTYDGCYVFANTSNANIGGYKTEDTKGVDDYWLIKFCESEVPQLPVANFTASNNSICAGGCFSFNNLSLNAGTFIWYFPGGNPDSSTATFPTNICYADTGYYSVTLIAINSDGKDTLTQTNVVYVIPLPSFTIAQTGDTLFAPQGMTSYQWYYNNTLLIFDTNYFHVGTQNGNYVAFVVDSNGCPGSDTLFSFQVSTEELVLINSDLKIYPNPAKNKIQISGKELFMGSEVMIHDVMGRLIYSDKITSDKNRISIENLNPGIYFIEVISKNGKLISRFVKE